MQNQRRYRGRGKGQGKVMNLCRCRNRVRATVRVRARCADALVGSPRVGHSSDFCVFLAPNTESVLLERPRMRSKLVRRA